LKDVTFFFLIKVEGATGFGKKVVRRTSKVSFKISNGQ